MRFVRERRFENRLITQGGALYWDFPTLLGHVQEAVAEAAENGITSAGIDTWGLDFGLLDRSGRLLQQPLSYRDPATQEFMPKVCRLLGRETIYGSTGIQFLPGNTIYQLSALAARQPELLEKAERLLMMPDLFYYFLTGEISAEYTIASTTQLVNCVSRQWDGVLSARLGLPEHIFPPLVAHGGSCPSQAAPQLSLVKVASHDTASAVISIPATESEFAYLSSGTWSVLGTERTAPVIDLAHMDWSNEAGHDSTVRYCKSLTGMWIFEECRRQDVALRAMSYPQILQLAAQAEPLRTLIDPQYPTFGLHCDMAAELRNFCRITGQTPPQTPGQLVRCIFESMALNYACALEELCEITGCSYQRLYIAGGGSKNTLINQMTANATGREIVAGPSEATVLGNFYAQLSAAGEISGISQYRSLLRGSLGREAFYMPQEQTLWRTQLERFRALRALHHQKGIREL